MSRPSEMTTNVRLSICASFELSPMLGRGEVLHSVEKSVQEWVNNTQTIASPRDLAGSSLLVGTEQRTIHHLDVGTSGSNEHDMDHLDLDWEVSSVLAEQTDLGHDALLYYQNNPSRENLDISIGYFERAKEVCPPDHECRAAVLRNLAMAKFLDYQINGTHASLDAIISLYREALDLYHFGEPDRPGTLLYLAQALVCRYDKQGCEEYVAAEVKMLMAEIQSVSALGSHERRAAELVLQTCARCGIINKSSSADLDRIISELDHSAESPPSGYFDRPQRMHNLAAVLLRRFELCCELSDLERSIAVHDEAIRIAPASHPDRPRMIASLGFSLFRRFERLREPTDLERSISNIERALQCTPESHPDRPQILTNLGISLLSRFEQVGDPGDLIKSTDRTEEALQLMPPNRFDTLERLGRAHLQQFRQAGDLGDLEKSIPLMEEVLRSRANSHPDRLGTLTNLGHAYFSRFRNGDALGDLDNAISVMEEVLELLRNVAAQRNTAVKRRACNFFAEGRQASITCECGTGGTEGPAFTTTDADMATNVTSAMKLAVTRVNCDGVNKRFVQSRPEY